MAGVGQVGALEIPAAELAELCRRYQVRELLLFGSAARGEMRADSDLDFVVEYQPGAGADLLDHAGLMLELTDLFGRKVDLVSKNALKPGIRDGILWEAVPVYAA